MSAESEWRGSARMVWQQLVQAGYLEWLLPIIPPWARLSPGSRLTAGKMPGLRMSDGTYVGFKNWQKTSTVAGDVALYASWPDAPGIGMRLGAVITYDMDLADEQHQRSRSLSSTVQNLIKQWMGPLSLRTRADSSRWAALFAADSDARTVSKQVYHFKDAATGLVLGKLELLANGQQVVVAGVHPDGALWQWPITRYDALPKINRTQITMLAEALVPTLGLMGINVEHGKSSGVYAVESTTPIGDKSLMSSSPDLLWSALHCIDNSKIDGYDEWFDLLRAIKAACGGNDSFFEQVVMPWCLAYQRNTPDVVRTKWDSITDSHLGAGYVERVARKWGYTGPPITGDFMPMDDDVDEGVVKPVADPDDWIAGPPATMPVMPPSDSGPWPAAEAIDDAVLVDGFKRTIGYGTHHIFIPEIDDWYVYEQAQGVWTYDRRGRRAQSRALDYIKGVGIPKLITVHRAREVVNSLSGSHRLSVREFDTDPWVINTPTGVVDLRPGGSTRPHHPGERFRFQAGVAPLPGEPSFFLRCALEWADDDEDLAQSYISLGASLLLGEPPSGWLANLHGERLNGKSTFVLLMKRILGNYAQQISAGLLVERVGVGRPSPELMALHKTRMVFLPEMPRKGFTTDIIKAWTGGDELVGRQGYDFTMQTVRPGRLVVNSNHAISYEADDPAMNARLRVVPFPRTFERDDAVRDRLLAEAPQIFQHLIDTVRQTGGHLHAGEAVIGATEAVLDEIAPSRRLARAALDCSRDYATEPVDIAHLCAHIRAVAQEQFATDAPVASLILLDDQVLLSHVLKAVSGQYWRIRQRRSGTDVVRYRGIKLRPLLSEWAS